MLNGDCDVIIIGGGPAGLSAAVSASSEGLRTALIEVDKEGIGGQAKQSTKIENFLGFADGITGQELTIAAIAQAKKFRTEFITPCQVSDLEAKGDIRIVTLDDDTPLVTKTVVIATGVSYRMLEAKGAAELQGRGLKYASPATLEHYEDKDVYIVGGANSAGQAAVHLSKQQGCRVHMVIRNESLSVGMSQYLHERIQKYPNVHVHLNTQVVEARGSEHLEELVLRGPDGERTVQTEHLFVLIGGIPKTAWLNGRVARDHNHYILTGHHIPNGNLKDWGRAPLPMETSMAGVFAAGDVRFSSTKRIASAVGEGSQAIQNIHEYLALRH